MPMDRGRQLLALHEWRRHGSILPACLLGMTLLAMHAYSLGVMMGPLEKEFGWSRSQISAGPLVSSVLTMLMAPFAGRAVDRFGPRPIALIGVPFFAVSLALIGTATPSILSWLALYALLSIALMFIFPTVWTAAIVARFDRNRGLALAIALSGTGITSAIAPITAATLVEWYGWRGAYAGLGAISFIVVFPVVFLLFDRRSHDRSAVGVPASDTSPSNGGAAMCSPRYIRLAAAAFIHSVGATGIGINIVPILIEEGFDLMKAAEIAGLLGIGTISGRLLGGVLLDRFDGKMVAAGCGAAAVLAAAILLATDRSAPAAALSCVCLGLAAGAEYDACAYLTTRYFLRRNFGVLFGLVGGLAGFGSGFSPLIANAIYDHTRTYETVLWCLIPLFSISFLLFLSLGKYPPKGELI